MIILFFVMPMIAYAYLDLGSGSYLIQMLLALMFAIPLSIKAFWQRIFAVFRRQKSEDENRKKDSSLRSE